MDLPCERMQTGTSVGKDMVYTLKSYFTLLLSIKSFRACKGSEFADPTTLYLCWKLAKVAARCCNSTMNVSNSRLAERRAFERHATSTHGCCQTCRLMDYQAQSKA